MRSENWRLSGDSYFPIAPRLLAVLPRPGYSYKIALDLRETHKDDFFSVCRRTYMKIVIKSALHL